MSQQTPAAPLPRILRALGVTDRDLASCTPLTGGTYNTVTRVTLTDGRDWVVKTPPPYSAGLRYERDLLVNEVTFYTAAAQAGGPAVPHVVHSEPDPTAPTGAYLVMTARPGRPWHEVDWAEGAHDEARLRAELGRIVGRLRTVTGPGGFGYPAAPLGPPAASWRTAFTAMTEAVLADAGTYRAPLPYPVDHIRTVLARAAPVLDDVTRPVLVHFDLWQGNLLVTGEPGARSIGGVIDGERMFWGDPVADFVSLALFGELEEDGDFLAGYAESLGGRLEFSDSVRLRLALYRSYLYLIMLVETVPRGVGKEAAAETRELVEPHLVAALDAVSRRASARSDG
ncbi:aminoglycoside phosphotransferase family protein [Streptomyces sp. ME02-6991-2A]|uniref:phosphotransferase family protein n=1 Tax=Streptomyces sp. ME02-6991-2A TaxID=3028677 RepID=UPI0029A900A5|nr:aminoglycoside phosphotransferase family protein [Streptomyces sp. ME02-6991-2A]MDX3379097.1 aminoglycoside phosphotransferase family protein [Streptomyces sp. ME02-6991-2A]